MKLIMSWYKNQKYQIKLHHLSSHLITVSLYDMILCNDDKIQQYLSFLL